MNNYAQKGIFLAALGGSLLLFGCSNTPAEQQGKMDSKMENVKDKMQDMDASTRAAFEADRTSITNDLKDLGDNIDNKLKEVNEELAKTDLKASERTDAEAMKAELEQEKSKVADEMTKVQNATAETWNDVKVEADKTTDDVKSWWGKLKDNVDKKTDVDNDNDGH